MGSTQPVTEMSTSVISWGRGDKGGQFLELTTLPPSYSDCLEILGDPTSWSPKGIARPVVG